MNNVFEESAREYDEWFVRHESAYQSELAAIKAFLPKEGQGLEIGVGTGRFAAPLGIKVGVEPAKAMADLARERGIKVCEACGEELPFKNGSFDFILMVTVLCFLKDPFGALQEATRVLKPQGRLIVGMIDPDSPLGKSYEEKKEKNKFYRQARFHSVSQVLDWLQRLGYENLMTCQTLYKNIQDIIDLEPVKAGYGEGGFVVIAARRSA
ncbi:MAG: class I SAM-dependent methyltransferase [Thermodesulfobacteriota bacterium]